MARIKGSKLTSKLDFVEQTYGKETVGRVLEGLGPDDRDSLRDVSLLAWYPSTLYDRLAEAICRFAAGGDETIYDRIGADSAERQLSTIYSAFRSHDVLQALKNMAPMHAHMNDPGRMEVTSGGPGECTIVVKAPRSTLLDCRISRAFYRRAVELSGAGAVTVEEPTCSARGDAACRFQIRWEER
jgi:predicted hydrocarbon binding protein